MLRYNRGEKGGVFKDRYKAEYHFIRSETVALSFQSRIPRSRCELLPEPTLSFLYLYIFYTSLLFFLFNVRYYLHTCIAIGRRREEAVPSSRYVIKTISIHMFLYVDAMAR